MKITFTSRGWEDYTYWQTADRKLLKRINLLIADICRDDPFIGIGKPEALRENLSGFWSRRITDEHRLVYGIADDGDEDTLVILQARHHY